MLLKPCPFCGGEAYLDTKWDDKNDLHIECKHKKNCIAKPNTWLQHTDYNIYEQIDLWNRRM